MTKHADVDRVVRDSVRGAVTALNVLTWIEQEVVRRAADLARACDDVDADGTSEQRVPARDREAHDAVAQMGPSTALAERLRKAEAKRAGCGARNPIQGRHILNGAPTDPARAARQSDRVNVLL